MSLTKQGIRDLDRIGNKSHLNGRHDRKQADCFHVWELFLDEDNVPFKQCQRCGYEEIG